MSITLKNLFSFFFCLIFLTPHHFIRAGSLQNEKIKVALVESEGYNEEVWLPFAQALSGLDDIHATLALSNQRYDVMKLLEGFRWANQPKLTNLKNFSVDHTDNERIDIYISASCDQEIISRNGELKNLFEKTEAQLFCVVHDAMEFQTGGKRFQAILPWMNNNRLRLVTLSEHVVQSLMNHLGPFQHLAKVCTFPPIFSIDPKLLGREEFPVLQRSDKTRRITVQGTERLGKYNQTLLIEQMKTELSSKERIKQGGGTLTFIGNGEDIYIKESTNIFRKKALSFTEYFRTIAQSDVLLLGRYGENFNFDQVDSSLAAALITGTPIVAGQEFLKAYMYMLPDALIQPKQGQNHLQAAFDYFVLPPLLHTRKRHAVSTLRKSILVQNQYKISQWIGA